ncbi:MAG: Fe-S cluster assembly protein SufD, partial [Schleiferiaceae bacterium]
PGCVNPAHLFVGSQRENLDDAARKGRRSGGSMPGSRNPFAKLTEELGPLAQLNTALAWDGLYVVVPDNVVVDRPIQVLSFTTGTEPQATQIRSLVVLGVNAQAEIIERHQSLTEQPTWTNSVDEAYLAAGAQLRWVKLQHDGPDAALTQHTRIQQARDSRAQVHTISTSGRFIRNNLDFLLNEPGADARMLGLTLAKGKQLVDHHTLVDHRAPHCTSHENYKGIYDDGAKGVFNGRIYVHQDAQKTDAYQQNANLVLHERAEVNTKPQLEIFADDVKCSHGCTVGQLDEDALFYLRARGIKEPEARALLMLAFAEDALSGIDHPSLNAKLHKLIAGKLGVDLTLDV